MKYLYALLVCIVIASSAKPLQAADFMLISDIGSSAETIGAGNVEGFNQSASTIFENPAGLYRIPHQSIALFTSTIMDEVHYSNMALSTTTPYGSIGLGFMQASVYDIPSTYETGDSDESIGTNGNFDYQSTIYKLSYQRLLLKDLSVGASYSYYNTQFFDVRGSGYDVDAGAVWERGALSGSLFARNILPHGKVKYNGSQFEPLPFHLVGGVKWTVNSLEIMPQLKIQQDNLLSSIGFRYNPSSLPFVNFLAGYKQHLTVTNENRQNLTFGIGLNLYGLHFNYAYERSDYVPMDNKSYFSINTFF